MRLEHIPLILGVIVALIGLGFIADASMAAAAPVTPERRRRARAEPSRTGEALVGIGTLCMAAALFGRDTWRYGTVSVLAGSVLLLIGVILNRSFLKEALLFRGPARRAEDGPSRVATAQGGGIHRRNAPVMPPVATPPRPTAEPGSTEIPAQGTARGSAAADGPVRHPTPPLASRAFRPAEPAPPTSPPPPNPEPKKTPERRRTPRGKR